VSRAKRKRDAQNSSETQKPRQKLERNAQKGPKITNVSSETQTKSQKLERNGENGKKITSVSSETQARCQKLERDAKKCPKITSVSSETKAPKKKLRVSRAKRQKNAKNYECLERNAHLKNQNYDSLERNAKHFPKITTVSNETQKTCQKLRMSRAKRPKTGEDARTHWQKALGLGLFILVL
jgi:hypothetical protein